MKTNLKNCRFCSRILALMAVMTTLAFVVQSAPTSGSYTTDVTQYSVVNPTQQALEQVNQILCTIKKTQFEHMVNQGQYVALVDTNTCNTSSSNTSGTNNVTNTPDMIRFIVNATQTNPESPIVAQIWGMMPAQNGQTQTLIKGTLTLNSPKTNLNPYGVFSLNFAGFPIVDGSPSNIASMTGYIISSTNPDGTGKLLFYQNDPNGGDNNVITLISNGNSYGYAKVQAGNNNGNSSGNSTTNYTVAFNNDLSLIDQNSGNQICYNRQSFNNLVYSYGVYDNNGNRVNINSGFPVIYKGIQTWISYFGLNVPPGMTLTNGDPISIVNSDNTQTAGTLFVRPGLMQSMSSINLTLAQLSGTQFNIPTINGSDILTWDASSQNFNKIGTQSCNSNGCNQTNISHQVVTNTQLENYANMASGGGGNNQQNPNINLWINGLGGGGNTQLSIGNIDTNNGAFTFIAPTNATSLKVWMASPVQPSNGSTYKLYCMSQCPADINGMITYNPEFDGHGNYQSGHLMEYTFDPANYILYLESPSLVPLVPSNSNTHIMTGPLITSTQKTVLENNSFDGYPHSYQIFNSTAINSYNSYSASGTGSSQTMNQFVSILVNGNLESFSPPLQLTYTNPNGGNVFLQYFGFGNLQGIPGYCEDSQGNDINCGSNGQYSVWVPSYSIPDGSELVSTIDNGTPYWVRQLNVAQQMQISPDCSSLSTTLDNANGLSLDTAGNNWIDPSGIGDMPNTIDSPKVINGIVQ